MGILIESEVWEPNKALYIFLFISCLCSIFFLPARTVANIFDHAPPASFLRFQRKLLLVYSLSSVLQGIWAVFGEYELVYYGLSKEQMLNSICISYAASLFLGSVLGMLSDLVGHKKLCLMYYILHLLVSVWKSLLKSPNIWLESICLSLASSIFSCSFETWMVLEHEKLGQRQDSLHDMFWLMAFFESASLIVSQVLGNYLIGGNMNKNISFVWNEAVALAFFAIIYISRGWKEAPQIVAFKDYRIMFHKHIVTDKRIWLLSCAQGCIHFSIAAFWILWAPTVVADGREVLLGLIYPCLMGSRMLGSTGFPWFFHLPLALRTEEYLAYAFIVMGIAMSIIAYDYQDIGVLVMLFCLFYVCLGLVLPSLARLRTMYIPNEVRAGMISASLLPANAAVLLCLVLRGYYQCIGNSTFIALAALGLFLAAGCMYTLKKWEKQLHDSRHNL